MKKMIGGWICGERLERQWNSECPDEKVECYCHVLFYMGGNIFPVGLWLYSINKIPPCCPSWFNYGIRCATVPCVSCICISSSVCNPALGNKPQKVFCACDHSHLDCLYNTDCICAIYYFYHASYRWRWCLVQVHFFWKRKTVILAVFNLAMSNSSLKRR